MTRKFILPILTILLAITMCFPAFASEKINKVSLKFSVEEYDRNGQPDVEVSCSGNTYSASSPELACYYYEDDEDATNTYEGQDTVYAVELSAEGDYVFNTTSSKHISLKGLGAEFVKASRKNNGTTLVVVVDLKDVTSALGSVSEAMWTNDGHGTWDAAVGAEEYTLMLTPPAGSSSLIHTIGTKYDFNPYMQKSGSYSYKVKPTAGEQSGGWTDGGTFYVSDALASQNRDRFELEKNVTYEGDGEGPGNMRVEYLNLGWQKNDNGRTWFRNEDGSYVQSEWLSDGSDWYWMDEDGFMAENEYVTVNDKEYYFGFDGKMYVNKETPDGRKSDKDGVLEKKQNDTQSGQDSDDDSAHGPGVTAKEKENEAEPTTEE